jgi:hypothetical protein
MSPARRSTQRRRKPPAKPPKIETPVETVSGDRRERLGAKHTCFSCGAKFYDLNKPEPICPKCNTNQTERPIDKPKPPEPPRKPARRPMELLDDDEEVAPSPNESDLDLDLGGLNGGEQLFDDGESSEEEPE